MRLAGIASLLEAANRFLRAFFPSGSSVLQWNAPRPHDRGRVQRLEEILSVRAVRKVAQDHTVSWEAKLWGVPREEGCAGLRGAP